MLATGRAITLFVGARTRRQLAKSLGALDLTLMADDPAGFELDYLPEELRGRSYYRPAGQGEERKETPDDDRSG